MNLNSLKKNSVKNWEKKRSTISNYLRLLKLDPIIQTGIRDGFLSMGHGRSLINIEDNNNQLKYIQRNN